MAEVIFKQSLVDNGYDLDKWQIESAGCWAYDGLSATDTAVLAASEMGLDLTNHNSRGISESLLDRFNLILCMEFDHKRTLQRNFTEAKERIFLLSEMADEEKEIDDPVGLSLEAYLDTTDEIRGYLDTGMEKIFQLSA
jgi:protein-tyrosine-phosphatase